MSAAVKRPDPRVLDADMELLDRQLVDPRGRLVGNVDDLELTAPKGGGAPYVTAILCGPAALGPRLGGLLGQWFVWVQRRLHPDPDPAPARIPFRDVTSIGSHVTLAVGGDDLPSVAFEHWVRDHVIAKIPGASHADE
jgi:sporulation protein YlmC with PRC-barrel domain